MPFFATILLNMMIAWILGGIYQAMTADDPPPEDVDQGHLGNSRSTNWILPLLYGRCRVGGNTCFMATTGGENQYLHMIVELGEGPIHGIARQDGSTFTETGTSFPYTNPPLLYFDGELWTDKWVYFLPDGTPWESWVRAEFFNGAADQPVCASMTAADARWNDPKRYTSYLYLRLTYNQNKWLTIPKVTVVVDGLKLYDPTAETIAYSDNFALAAYDVMTRPSRRGGMGLDVWHGPVPENPRVPISFIEAARAYCEEKGWAGGIPLTEDLDCWSKLDTILQCFRGEIIYSECQYKMRFRDLNYESAVKDIAESDVVTRGGRTTLTIKPATDLYELSNAIEVEYISAEKQYQSDIYLKHDSDALAVDGDMRKTTKNLPGLNVLEKVQPMAWYYLERLRWGHRASMATRDALINLEPMDLVTVTHSMPGWSGWTGRVLSMVVGADHTIALELEEEDVDLYDDEYNPSELSWHTTTLPDPTAAVPDVINVSIAEVATSTRLRSATRLVVDFTGPANYPWWDYAQIWLRIEDDTEWRFMTQSRGGYIYEPVEEGKTYRFKLVSVNIWGAAEDFDIAYEISRLITGQSSVAPGNITGLMAIANGDSVSIYANQLAADDIEGYEVRLGPAWTGGIFMSFNKAPSLRLSGVRPGTHTFGMAAKSNAGIYSATPASATCRVFVPPGYTSAHAWAWDYSTGTFTNAEQYSYSGNDVLRCIHTGGVLVGTWESPTYDMGSLKVVRCWGDFLTLFISGSSTWGGVAPSPATWGDIYAATKTWAQIFQPSAAAQLEAVLEYSEDDSDWNEIGRFEILSGEVYARYLRVIITITDPNMEEYLYVRELNMSAFSGPS